jgi:hypothetical protein
MHPTPPNTHTHTHTLIYISLRYAINYLHLGAPKTWYGVRSSEAAVRSSLTRSRSSSPPLLSSFLRYGVRGSEAEAFERAMRRDRPELFSERVRACVCVLYVCVVCFGVLFTRYGT